MSIKDEHHKLLFGIRRSVRYHSRRQQFYEQFHQLVIFTSVLLGSATIGIFAGSLAPDWPLYIKLLPAVLVTVLSAADLVIGTIQKAWKHANLCRQFIELEQELEHIDIDDNVIAVVTKKRLSIEMTEPPILKVLDTLCHNELLRAMGYERDQYIKVGPLQRLCAPFFDFGEHTLQC